MQTIPPVKKRCLTIWTRPQATICGILDEDPEHMVFMLGIILGISDCIDRSYAKSSGELFTVPAIFTLCLVMGPIGGLTLLYGASALIKWTGKLLGGQGSHTHIRAAFAWSSVPLICGLLLWIPGVLLFGGDLFAKETPRIDASTVLQLEYACWVCLRVILFFWSLIVFLKCLAAVQGFSSWRALLNVVLSFVPFVILILPAVWLKKLF